MLLIVAACHVARAGKATPVGAIAPVTLATQQAAALAQQTGSRVAVSAADVLTSSDLTLFTVSDNAIEILANEAAGQVGGLLATKKLRLSSRHRAVIHTSGAHDRQALVALQRMGWLTGSLHPALPFTGADYATPEHFSGAGFALEADDEQLFDWMERIAQALGASAFRLKQGQKALYHAALAMTSNYTVTLYAFAEHLLTTAGLSEAAAESTLNALLHATLTNLARCLQSSASVDVGRTFSAICACYATMPPKASALIVLWHASPILF